MVRKVPLGRDHGGAEAIGRPRAFAPFRMTGYKRRGDDAAAGGGPDVPLSIEEPTMTKRKPDARARALLAQRPPADAVSYMPPPGRLSLIIKLVGTDQDRLTRPGERSLFCYTDRLSYRPGETVRFHTSTSAAQYSMEIARVGARREVVWTKTGIPGALHPTPPE